jgi:hypothetical protein
MITSKDLRGASKKWRSLPQKEKRAISEKVERMTQEVEAFDQEKERNIKTKLKDLSYEAAGYCDKKIVRAGVSLIVDGAGKKAICSVCIEHESVMSRMPDGAWYCQKHKSLWDCPEDEKKNERSKYYVSK